MEGAAAGEEKPQGRWDGARVIGVRALYNFLLFGAYWFGANRFDCDGDGSFDPSDLKSFLRDSRVALRNFTRHAPPDSTGQATPLCGARTKELERPSTDLERPSAGEAREATREEAREAPREEAREAPREDTDDATDEDMQEVGDEAESGAADEPQEEPGENPFDDDLRMSPPASVGSSSRGRRTPNGWFSWNWWRNVEPAGSDGSAEVEKDRTDAGDDRAVGPEEIEAPPPAQERREVRAPERSERSKRRSPLPRLRQHRPYFVVCQAAFIFLLWFIGAIAGAAGGEGSFLTIQAGLDSIWEGGTDLRLHALCEGCTSDDVPGPPTARCENYAPQIWRWFTYQYTHGGLVHVTMNCLLILLFGIPLEGLHGTARLAAMFNAGVIGGALCYFIYDAHQAVVGASGGCYALLGIHVANVVMNWDKMKFRVPMLVFILVLIVVEIASYRTSIITDVSNASHIGGAVAGLIIGIVSGENLKVRKWEIVIQVSSCCLGLILAVFCIAWLGSAGSFRNLYESDPWCWVAQVWHEDTHSYKCVKCGDQGCIDMWLRSPHVYETTHGNCQAVGYLETTQ